MLKYIRQKKAQSLFEYVVLIIFILGAFLIFQKYIVRAFSGRWKNVGDAMGQGRIYDPHLTTECRFYYDSSFDPGFWYNYTCYQDNCKEPCLTLASSECRTCLEDPAPAGANCDVPVCQP